jgi:hypothetical protein
LPAAQIHGNICRHTPTAATGGSPKEDTGRKIGEDRYIGEQKQKYGWITIMKRKQLFEFVSFG